MCKHSNIKKNLTNLDQFIDDKIGKEGTNITTFFVKPLKRLNDFVFH
jgi:hypothetical protein